MNRWVKPAGAVLLILALLCGAGCKRHVAPKTVTQPQKREAVKQTVEAFGIIKARDYKDINLDFPAQITRVPVKDGQNVKMGEALIYLNINDFQAMIKNRENELNLARFELLKQEKTLRDARTAYEKARRQLADKEQLLREGLIARKEADDYRDVVLAKEKEVTDIQLSMNQSAAVNGIDVGKEKVAVLEYDLNRMRNKLNQSFLKGNVIVSDFSSGVIYDLACAAGYSVGTGEKQQKLLSIMNLNSLYVSADVTEEFVKDVKIGAAVTIIPVADNKRKYHGKVVRVSDIAVKQNGETNVAVEISIDHPDGFLKPNFNVDVEIAK
jgi:HlyD family secretion protein